MSLDDQLQSLDYLLARWRTETDPEARQARQRAVVECLWDVAMNLPVPDWGYLPLPAGQGTGSQLRLLLCEPREE